jgi:ATP-dependent Clp protease ATP-binding subunit ClpC
VLDDGRLTDGQGHTVDFRNTVIIMTSNVGTDEIRAGTLGFRRDTDRIDLASMRKKVEEGLKKTFRPEFLNRIDETIIFHSLTMDDLTRIVELEAREVIDRLAEQGIALELSAPAKELLVREGYDPIYGARPLRRTVQRLVETPLSRALLKNEFVAGDIVQVDVEGDRLRFTQGATLDVEHKEPAEQTSG